MQRTNSPWRPGYRLALCLCALSLPLSGFAGSPAPRNVVLFLGDGMGVPTVTAARILAGQRAGGLGEEHLLSFERFAHVALVKTYTLDKQVPDSAGTMTAIVTGQKTRSGVISVAGNVPRGDCAAGLANPLPTLLEQAEARGLATGIVTTTRITHATPAATYGHAAERDWEDDAALSEEAKAEGCHDLARQLLDFNIGDGLEVMLGGGRAQFTSAAEADPEYADQVGNRADGRNLIADWLAGGERAYVWRRADLLALANSPARQILGLFEPSHMQFDADRDADLEPSLAEMTTFALNRLAGQGAGYLLLVEAGRIDHAHHGSNARRALEDVLALDAAVEATLALTDPTDTLILVTADHGHTLSIGGYPSRGNPILGAVDEEPVASASAAEARDLRGLPYTTLTYANGPGWRESSSIDPQADTEALDYQQAAAYPTPYESHSGADVAAYGWGLNAAALGGVMEQDRLYTVLAGALFGPEEQ